VLYDERLFKKPFSHNIIRMEGYNLHFFFIYYLTPQATNKNL